MRLPSTALTLVLTVGCGADASAVPPSFALRIAAVTALPVDGVVLDEAAVRGIVEGAAARSHSLVGKDGTVDLPTWIHIGEIDGQAGGRVLRAEFASQVPAGHQAVLGRSLEAVIELERRDGTLDADEDVPETLARGVSVLDAKLRLLRGGVEDARALLGDDDPEIVVLALEQVGRQRWRDEADRVAALVGHADARVVSAAVECLGIVGGERHATTLLRHVRLADADQTRRLYDTLAALGGDEAQGFLEFAARNEDDPLMADVAERALRRMDGGVAAEVAESADTLRGHRP